MDFFMLNKLKYFFLWKISDYNTKKSLREANFTKSSNISVHTHTSAPCARFKQTELFYVVVFLQGFSWKSKQVDKLWRLR